MTTAEQPHEPSVQLYPPAEALQHARPLPPPQRLAVENVSDDEWAAFQEALTEA